MSRESSDDAPAASWGAGGGQATAYLLQAFLCHNQAWEVLLAMNFLMRDRTREFRAVWPNYDPATDC